MRDTVSMPIYQLERTQPISLGIDACWRFFSDPRNLRKITPPEMNFRIKRDLPPAVYPGLMIEYTVSPLFGIPLTWLTEIVHVDPPHRFVDEQRAGPYRIWHHEHTFRALSENETEMHDLVTYAPPFGPLGAIANTFIIRRQLEKIFDYRTKHLPSAADVAAA